MKKRLFWLLPAISVPVALAGDDVQDMSDPLSVYTQVGGGITDKGLNLKVGQTYDTGVEGLAGMNIIEVKGVLGEVVGFNSDESLRDDSIDSIRFRNFRADLTTGKGSQIDISYNAEQETGSASYSLIRALPSLGPVSLYPLAGAGVAYANNTLKDGTKMGGYTFPGTFVVVGTYAKLALTDDIWLNYNPMYKSTLSGDDNYTEYGMEGDDSVLTHEFALSYQINPRFNVRYFANWTENTDFSNGDHRIEFNYQL
ncbi:hypothetical protein [Vibrio maerlii]|uniref:hypothetical protein n=1 Tax=Vibrio maerlii TaxID=2231648 RepID=UPI000E3DF439|nr:hypothetical protein [Vibrio maerlii]